VERVHAAEAGKMAQSPTSCSLVAVDLSGAEHATSTGEEKAEVLSGFLPEVALDSHGLSVLRVCFSCFVRIAYSI